MSYRIKVVEGRASAAGRDIPRDSGYKIESQITRVGAGSRCDLRIDVPGLSDGLLFQIEYSKIEGKSAFKVIPQVDDALELDGRSINIGDEVQWMLGSRVVIYDSVVLELAYKRSSRSKPKEDRKEENTSEKTAEEEESWRRRRAPSTKRRPERSSDDLGELFTQSTATPERKTVPPGQKESPAKDKKAAQSSKERMQLLVTVFCFAIAGLLMLKSALPNIAPKETTTTELDDVEARKIAEADSALLKAFDKAVWAEKANEAQAQALFQDVRDKARDKFKNELVGVESEEKKKICSFFNYLEKKIAPPSEDELTTEEKK